MKYLITESSLDNTVRKLLSSKKRLMPNDYASKIIRMYLQLNPDVSIENLIFEKLDGKKFIPIEKYQRVYFVNSENDEYAQIKYNMDDGLCIIEIKLIREISSFFSLENYESRDVIKDWVENELQMKVTQVNFPIHTEPLMLHIPS